jgi:hypothetical protein
MRDNEVRHHSAISPLSRYCPAIAGHRPGDAGRLFRLQTSEVAPGLCHHLVGASTRLEGDPHLDDAIIASAAGSEYSAATKCATVQLERAFSINAAFPSSLDRSTSTLDPNTSRSGSSRDVGRRAPERVRSELSRPRTILQIGPPESIAVAYFELMPQGLRCMVNDQLQRKFGHQVLKQLGDDLVTESRFDFPHVDDAFRWTAVWQHLDNS